MVPGPKSNKKDGKNCISWPENMPKSKNLCHLLVSGVSGNIANEKIKGNNKLEEMISLPLEGSNSKFRILAIILGEFN